MLFSRAFALLAAPVSGLDTGVAHTPSSHCGRICQQRALHGATLSSAAYGIMDVMDAVPGAYDHCAGKAKGWCPKTINSTCHQIARALIMKLPADEKLNGKAGFSRVVDQSQAAYAAGLGWAYKTFGGKDYGVAPTRGNAQAFTNLSNTVDRLRKKKPIYIEWKAYGKQHATGTATPVALQRRGDSDGEVAAGVVAAALLALGGYAMSTHSIKDEPADIPMKHVRDQQLEWADNSEILEEEAAWRDVVMRGRGPRRRPTPDTSEDLSPEEVRGRTLGKEAEDYFGDALQIFDTPPLMSPGGAPTSFRSELGFNPENDIIQQALLRPANAEVPADLPAGYGMVEELNAAGEAIGEAFPMMASQLTPMAAGAWQGVNAAAGEIGGAVGGAAAQLDVLADEAGALALDTFAQPIVKVGSQVASLVPVAEKAGEVGFKILDGAARGIGGFLKNLLSFGSDGSKGNGRKSVKLTNKEHFKKNPTDKPSKPDDKPKHETKSGEPTHSKPKDDKPPHTQTTHDEPKHSHTSHSISKHSSSARYPDSSTFKTSLTKSTLATTSHSTFQTSEPVYGTSTLASSMSSSLTTTSMPFSATTVPTSSMATSTYTTADSTHNSYEPYPSETYQTSPTSEIKTLETTSIHTTAGNTHMSYKPYPSETYQTSPTFEIKSHEATATDATTTPTYQVFEIRPHETTPTFQIYEIKTHEASPTSKIDELEAHTTSKPQQPAAVVVATVTSTSVTLATLQGPMPTHKYPIPRWNPDRPWAATLGHNPPENGKCSDIWELNDYYKQHKKLRKDEAWSKPEGRYQGQCKLIIPKECSHNWKKAYPNMKRRSWPEYCSDPGLEITAQGVTDVPTYSPGFWGHMMAVENKCLENGAKNSKNQNCNMILDTGNWGPNGGCMLYGNNHAQLIKVPKKVTLQRKDNLSCPTLNGCRKHGCEV